MSGIRGLPLGVELAEACPRGGSDDDLLEDLLREHDATAGFELIISGTGVQKVAVHLVDPKNSAGLIIDLKKHKSLQQFSWNERVRKPGL